MWLEYVEYTSSELVFYNRMNVSAYIFDINAIAG